MAKSKKQKADPSVKHTIVTLRSEPAAIAQQMSVDRVHSVVRAAENGQTRDLFTLYRDVISTDSHLQTELAKRKLAVLGDQMSVMPWDKKSPSDVTAATAIEEMIHNCRSWKAACIHLFDSVLWPVSVVEKVFSSRSTSSNPYGSQPRSFYLSELAIVPHYLLDYSTGSMRINDVDPISGTILSTSREVDPDRYIVHRGHLLSSPDNWGGPMRSILFWWLLSTQGREWWARFLDRYGSPFIVAKHAKGDDHSRGVLRAALALSVKLGGLVVSDETMIELVQASSAQSGDAYDKFITVCQREKSKLILGQTLSAEAQPTGLGSGVSGMQESVRQDIRAWDGESLSETLRLELFSQYLQINGIIATTPNLTWGSVSPAEMKARADLLVAFSQAGIRPTQNALANLSEETGIELEFNPTPPGVGAPRPFLSSYSAR